MKKLVAAALFAICFISTLAFAASSITDMLYLPKEGSIYAEPYYSYYKSEGDFCNHGIKYATSEVVRNDIDLEYGYGISSNLALGLAVSYLLGYTSTSTYTSDYYATLPPSAHKKTEIKFSGIGDPNVFIKYRAIDDNIILDIIPGFSPGFMEAKKADTENDGNNARGGHMASARLEVAKKMDELTLGAMVSYDYYFERKTTNQTSDVKSKVTGGNVFSLGIMGQYNIDPILIHLGLRYVMLDKEEHNTEGSVHKIDSRIRYDGMINLGYVAVPDQVLINLKYRYSKGKDIDMGEGITLEGWTSQEISLGTRLLF